MAALQAKQPRAFILESARGLATSHQKTFGRILQKLRSIGGNAYDISWRLVNTEEHGIPQHRERVYIVGVKKILPKDARHSHGQHPVHQDRWPLF